MSNNTLARLATRIFDTPLMIMPEKLAIITQVLEGRVPQGVLSDLGYMPPEGSSLGDMSFMQPTASRFVGDNTEFDESGRRRALPYQRTASGQAIITISGSLVNRGAYIGARSGVLSYEGIAAQLKAAASDPKVTSIILDMDTPGGEAVGAMELAALVRAVNRVKPVYAVVNGLAASAGYAIASGAKAIFSTESGVSGSIGVVVQHMDLSRAADRAGISVNYIHAGKHKVDGHGFAPLSPEVRAQLQAEVNKFYDLFISAVAEGRGNRLSADAARATEARTYIGASAKEAGLVDDIDSFEMILTSLSRSAFRSSNGRITRMNMYNESDLAAARAEGAAESRESAFNDGFTKGEASGFEKGVASGRAEGEKAGALAERERISAIRNLPDADGRESTAMHLALTTDLPPEAVAGVLSGVPKANTIASRSNDVSSTAVVDTGQKKPAATLDRQAIYKSVMGR